MYTIQFQNGDDILEVMVTPGLGELFAIQDNLNPGSSYMVRIAASNGAGMGPYSTPDLIQIVLSRLNDVVFETATGFLLNTNRDITPTSIPVVLPAVANIGTFR